MIISYEIRGRFGNNLFQYYAMKIIQRLFHDLDIEYTYVYNTKPNNCMIVGDSDFKELYKSLKNKTIPPDYKNKNIYLYGYFQFLYFLEENIDYVKELFSEKNNEKINNNIYMNVFVEKVNNCEKKYNNNDLVVHIRLDDFIQSGLDNNIIDPNIMRMVIDDIKRNNKDINNIVIIVDKLRRGFEMQYMDILTKFRNDIKIISSSMEEDFSQLYRAKNIVCSNSTFSWWAALLGNSDKNWFPNTNNYYTNQEFNRINSSTIVYQTKYIQFS